MIQCVGILYNCIKYNNYTIYRAAAGRAQRTRHTAAVICVLRTRSSDGKATNEGNHHKVNQPAVYVVCTTL